MANEKKVKKDSRFDKYPTGAVPQSTRTPGEQLKYLDEKGFVATKERAKLVKKLLAEINTLIKPVVAAMNKDRGETK
jgi:hypothetical protein